MVATIFLNGHLQTLNFFSTSELLRKCNPAGNMKSKYCRLRENMIPVFPEARALYIRPFMGLSYQKTWQHGISNHSDVALSKIGQLHTQ